MPRPSVVFALFALAATSAARADRCPSPSVGRGPFCVLTRDATISEPMIVPAGTTLDCLGFTLKPTKVGSFAADGTDILSVPEVAVAIIASQGSSIRNCKIGTTNKPFDLGVVVANAHPDGHSRGCASGALNELVGNKISARLDPVSILSSDRTWVIDNELSWVAGGGDGVQVLRDSSDNWIRNNRMESPGTPLLDGEQDRKLPGTAVGAGGCADCAVITADPFFFPLFNLVIGSQLIQLPYVGHGPKNTLIEDNEIDLPGDSTNKYHLGVAAAVTSDGTTARGNTIHQGGFGLGMEGFAQAELACYPGVCSGDSKRLCTSDEDCFIEGIDRKSNGTCSVDVADSSTGNTCSNPTVPADGLVYNTVFDNNDLIGPFGNGLGIYGDHNYKPVVSNNRVTGTGTEIGFYMTCEALGGATVTHNSFSNFANALYLDDSCAPDVANGGAFGAKVTRNDFEILPNNQAVLTWITYHYKTELSVDGVGNYWGNTCAQGGFTKARGPFTCAYDNATSCTQDSDCVLDDGTCDQDFEGCTGDNNIYCHTDAECSAVTYSCATANASFDSDTRDVVDSHPFGKPVDEARRPCP